MVASHQATFRKGRAVAGTHLVSHILSPRWYAVRRSRPRHWYPWALVSLPRPPSRLLLAKGNLHFHSPHPSPLFSLLHQQLRALNIVRIIVSPFPRSFWSALIDSGAF